MNIPAILINLDRSADRLARMRAEFARVGMAFERFSAVNGTDLPPNVRSYFCDASGRMASFLRDGEIGIYASHLSVWQNIAAGQYGSNPVMVCEDDLALPENIRDMLAEVLDRAPIGWDIIRFSSETKRRIMPVALLASDRALVRYTRSPINLGAYLVTQQGAAKLIRSIGIRKMPVDRDLTCPWLFGIDEFGVLPPPIEQNIGQSIISTMGGRARDRNLLRRSRDKWRRLVFNLRKLGLWQIIRAQSPHPPFILPG
jgi:glycosyl transferase, family 25